MKVAFYVLVATCLISGFSAADLSAFEDNFDLESVLDETVVHHDDGVKILWPTTEDPRLTRPTSTEPSTTAEPTSTTTTTAPTTTTERPHPPTRPTHPTPVPTSTHRPHPPTRPPHTTPTPTSTHRPRPTRPPRPSTTSFRPRPLPIVKRPQIYNNRVNSLKPFASNLVNLVLNKGGKQRTIQKNQIFYNIRNRPAPRLMNEEEPIF